MSSGSVPGAKLEKIRSGQAYLYQKNGMESEVMEITFRGKVSGSFLNQALLETIKRYPYLNTKLVELDGDFYIIQNEMALTARKTEKLAKLLYFLLFLLSRKAVSATHKTQVFKHRKSRRHGGLLGRHRDKSLYL